MAARVGRALQGEAPRRCVTLRPVAAFLPLRSFGPLGQMGAQVGRWRPKGAKGAKGVKVRWGQRPLGRRTNASRQSVTR
jgi:hypothetical protein